MKTPPNAPFSATIKQLEADISKLKVGLVKPHLTNNAEHDYDIKSQIINKQNQLIELLMQQTHK